MFVFSSPFLFEVCVDILRKPTPHSSPLLRRSNRSIALGPLGINGLLPPPTGSSPLSRGPPPTLPLQYQTGIHYIVALLQSSIAPLQGDAHFSFDHPLCLSSMAARDWSRSCSSDLGIQVAKAGEPIAIPIKGARGLFSNRYFVVFVALHTVLIPEIRPGNS